MAAAASGKGGFQSPLPLRGATCLKTLPFICPRISIPAPLAGSDRYQHPGHTGVDYFNPRSPCGERQGRILRSSQTANFNPRSPCGERPLISPPRPPAVEFQSPLPLRGATPHVSGSLSHPLISIPAPLAGSDTVCSAIAPSITYFNPRSPCGERPEGRPTAAERVRISIPAPLAGSDLHPVVGRVTVRISIPAPLAGSDPRTLRGPWQPCYFNPRSPCGERQHLPQPCARIIQFQSPLPLRGATEDRRGL